MKIFNKYLQELHFYEKKLTLIFCTLTLFIASNNRFLRYFAFTDFLLYALFIIYLKEIIKKCYNRVRIIYPEYWGIF